MKKIIVAVDFSKDSIHALEYGILIANKIQSDLMMVWVDNMSTQMNLLPYEHEISHEIKEDAKINMEELLLKYKKDLQYGKLMYKLRKGKVYQEIAFQAKASGASLIIAGAHGITGFEEYWVGSNAYRIVVSAPCPVITIQQSYHCNGSLEKIVLPIDSTAETIQKVPFTTWLASFFNSDIHLLTLFSPSLASLNRKTESIAKQAEKYIQSKGLKAFIEPMVTDNITSASLRYTEAIKAGLIAIMTEQEITSDFNLLGTSAQQIINNSAVPVLSIKPQKTFLFN